MWDVDGSGLQKVDDAGLAARLRARVNGLNAKVTTRAAGATLLFVLLPELVGFH